MSDLRVNTHAIADAYLTKPSNQQLWNVSPVWQPQAAKELALLSPDNAPRGAKRVIDGVIALFEAKTSTQHREVTSSMTFYIDLYDDPVGLAVCGSAGKGLQRVQGSRMASQTATLWQSVCKHVARMQLYWHVSNVAVVLPPMLTRTVAQPPVGHASQ
jgi:hypothetical protein